MNLIFFLILSVTICILTLVIAIIKHYNKNFLKFIPIPAYYILCAGMFFSIYFALLPFVIQEDYKAENVFLPMFNTLLVFTGERDFDFEVLNSISSLRLWYSGYLSFLYIFAPVLTIGFIIQFFSNWITKVKYWIFSKREAYVFNVLDKRTIITARDIRNKNKKAIILFLDTKHDDDNEEYYKAEAAEIRASVISEDIKNFYFGTHKGKLNIILALPNDLDNITDFIELIKEKKLEKSNYNNNIDIYIFSSTEQYENLVKAFIEKEKEDLEGIKVVLVDEIRNIIYKLLIDKPLYGNLKRNEKIKLLIIGKSRLAKELIRVASWMGQMLTHSLEIALFTKKAEEIEEEFEFLYPELNLNCDIKFINSKKPHIKTIFNEFKPTYVVIAEEDELENLKIGIELATETKRNQFLYDDYLPEIFIWNKKSEIKDQIEELKDDGNNNYNIIPFGGVEEQFNSNNIFNSELDKLGLQVHMFYSGYAKTDMNSAIEREYYLSEYNRKSSIAAAIHNIYRKEDLRNLSNKEYPLKKEELEEAKSKFKNELLKLEHLRWNAYTRARGFQTLPLDMLNKLIIEEKMDLHFSDQLKLHACLVDWNPDINNPLKENGVSFTNISIEEILAWLEGKRDPIDELDKVTLFCWFLRKKDLPVNIQKPQKMEGNFKNADESVINIIDFE